MKSNQKQSGGNDSTNIQAGNDINLYGVSADEARAIALDVFRANFLDLRDVAAEVAIGRAEKITRDFLEELWRRAPDALKSMQDPDMLRTMFRAQSEYACSGEEDLERALIDLLVDRAEQKERDIKTIVLNEAVATVPKLTADQRSAIALSFMIRHTRYNGPLVLETFYQHLCANWAPLATGLPTRSSAYQHIEYAGAASIVRIVHLTVEDSLVATSSAFFTMGFTHERVPEQLHEFLNDQRIFRPCLRAPELLQVSVMAEQNLKDLALDMDQTRQLAQLINIGLMTHAEIRADVIEHVPAVSDLFETWNDSDLRSMQLTTVGIAIGHAYWRRVSGQDADLGIWI